MVMRFAFRKGSCSPSLIETFPLPADGLEDEVARLRAQLGETNERLDFAERLLTRGEESRREESRRDP
jgi:hypothetical protein